jgi:hypothetical protein
LVELPKPTVVPVDVTLGTVENVPMFAPLTFWLAVQLLALARFSAMVPEPVIVPPVKPVPAVTDVTVPVLLVKPLGLLAA